MSAEHNVIVCGAGAAGLGTAAAVRTAGQRPLVLERDARVASSWRRRYPQLRLNTVGWMSGVPGYRARRRRYGGDYPSRDDWVRYLEDVAAHHSLELRTGVEVERIDRGGRGWTVRTQAGPLTAPFVVVATGFDHDPYVPAWPGRERFTGELLHASRFGRGADYEGRDVLLVGAGTTGTELAHFVAEGGAARVRLATRTPPNIFPRKWLGAHLNLTAVALDRLPNRVADAASRATQRLIFGDLSEYGLPFPPLGVRSTIYEKLQGPAVDAGFVESVKSGRIEIVPAVEAFEGPEVLVAGGTRITPDVVIACTGYERGLEPLVGHLGVLDERGLPTVRGGQEDPNAPGLFFAGFWASLSGQLRRMRFEARGIARALRGREVPAG